MKMKMFLLGFMFMLLNLVAGSTLCGFFPQGVGLIDYITGHHTIMNSTFVPNTTTTQILNGVGARDSKGIFWYNGLNVLVGWYLDGITPPIIVPNDYGTFNIIVVHPATEIIYLLTISQLFKCEPPYTEIVSLVNNIDYGEYGITDIGFYNGEDGSIWFQYAKTYGLNPYWLIYNPTTNSLTKRQFYDEATIVGVGEDPDGDIMMFISSSGLFGLFKFKSLSGGSSIELQRVLSWDGTYAFYDFGFVIVVVTDYVSLVHFVLESGQGDFYLYTIQVDPQFTNSFYPPSTTMHQPLCNIMQGNCPSSIFNN